jgi:hypothetical protein
MPDLAFGLRNLRVKESAIDAAVRDAAKILSIEPLLDRRPRHPRSSVTHALVDQISGRNLLRCMGPLLADFVVKVLGGGSETSTLRLRFKYDSS